MKNIKKIYFAFILGITLFTASATTVFAAAPQVVNLSVDRRDVPKYEKIEWTFDLNKSYSNPYYYYGKEDTPSDNPSNMTWVGEDGVTVDLHLTSPSGKSITVPAFYDDYLRINSGKAEIMGSRRLSSQA